MTKPYGTVLIKAAKIMDYLAEEPNKSLQEIAAATDLTNSTALKILETLQLIGYVAKDKQKEYRLGSKLVKYANKNIQELDLVEISLPFLEELQEKAESCMSINWNLKIKPFACRRRWEFQDLYIAQRWGKLY